MPDTADIQQDNPIATPEGLATAAATGPQPSSQLAATLTGSPTAPATPAPAPAQPTPQQQAAAADVAHHSALGKAVSFLLGKQRQYVPDPKTGAPMAVDVPQKPGELFRHILASAILGGAAGQGTNSPIAGFTRGASAGIQANMQADAQKRAQSQRDFENRQAADRQTHEQNIEDERLKQEKLRTEAQIQTQNVRTLVEEHDLNLREKEYVDKFNEHQEEIREQTYNQSGIDAPITGNGEVGNGAKLQKLRIQQPGLFQAPAGYHTVYTTSVDMNGLKFDPGKGYVDENGNAVDLASRTAHFVQFVPHDSTQERITIKGSKVKKLLPDWAGLVEDEKDYTMPFEHWVGAISSARQKAHTEARQDWRDRHDEITRQLGEMKDRADNLTRQIDTLSRNPVPDDDTKAQIADLTAQRQQVWDDYDAAQAQAHPNSRLRKQTAPAKNSAASAPASGMSRYEMNGQSIDVPIGSDKEKAILQKYPDLKPKATSVPAGKAAIYNKWGFVGMMDKSDVAKSKKKDAELGNKAGTTYIEGPDAPKTSANPPSSEAATAASLQ